MNKKFDPQEYGDKNEQLCGLNANKKDPFKVELRKK